MMRFVATGDLQAHNWRAFSFINERGLNSRLANILKVLQKIGEYTVKNRIRNFFILGDVYEINDYIDVDVQDAVFHELQMLQKRGLEVFIVPGNHDISAIKQSGVPLDPFAVFESIATVIRHPSEISRGVVCVPYHPDPQKMKQTFADIAKNNRDRFVLMSHLSVEGGKVGPKKYLLRCPIKLRDLHASRWHLVLLSDFHTRQKIAPNVWYMGSPLQHSFGETHEPCFWDVQTDFHNKGFPTVKKIYTNMPKFVRAFISKERFKTLAKMAKHGKRSRLLSGNYVKAVLADGVNEFEFRNIATKLKFLVEFDRVHEVAGNPDITDMHFDPQELIERYVEKNMAQKIAATRLIHLGHKLYEGDI